MLQIDNTLLLIIDVQNKLAKVMHNREQLFAGLQKAIMGAKVLGLPILWVEQNPKGLGPTVPEIAGLIPDLKPISKISFSCCQNETFMEALKRLNRKQILITGIEAHICVYQAAVDLLDLGYDVQFITDAVSSRTTENKVIGLEKMKDAGAGVTSVETSLFELLKAAEGEEFKEIIKIVK
jgi:nicotinamidase-related amidase